MALDFDGNVNALVDYGSGAALDNAVPFTKLFWFRLRTGFATNDRFWTKSTSADASIHVNANDEIRLRAFTGDPAVAITNDSPLLNREDDWLFLAVTYDEGAAQFGHIYTGDLTTVVTERTLGVNNNVAWGDDSAQDYTVGNRSSGGLALSGEIAMFADFDFAMTLAEIRRLQFRPDLWVGPGSRIFTQLGFNGTGTQHDLSGNGNSGTVSLATVADHVPLPPPFGFDRFSFAAAAAVTNQAINAIAVGVATVATAKTIKQAVTAVAVGVADVVKKMFVTIPAVAVGVGKLLKKMFVTIPAVAVGVATVATTKVISQIISAVAVGVATVNTAAIMKRAIAAVAVGVAAVNTTACYFRQIAATAVGVVGSVTGLVRDIVRIILQRRRRRN